MDIIRINVPTFIRLLELAREEVKNDPDLHDIAEIATRLSQEGVISMDEYDSIVNFMKSQGDDEKPESDDEDNKQDDLERIKKLGGM